MESFTLLTSIALPIQGFSMTDYSFILLKLPMRGKYSPSFTPEEPETCRCSTPYCVLLQAVQSTSQKIWLQLCWAPWKCKNIWWSAVAPESPPPPHTAPEMSLVAQGPWWNIQHLTRAGTNAETFVPMTTIKCSLCSGLQAWSGRHSLLPTSETGTWSEIQHCLVSSYLIFKALCDFLGLFLELYGLNISYSSAA